MNILYNINIDLSLLCVVLIKQFLFGQNYAERRNIHHWCEGGWFGGRFGGEGVRVGGRDGWMVAGSW